jgi:pilus assembly protein Flp/PilA
LKPRSRKKEIIMLKKLLRRFRKEEKGVTAIEYGLIAVLIAVAIIIGVRFVGQNLNTTFSNVAGTLSNPSGS